VETAERKAASTTVVSRILSGHVRCCRGVRLGGEVREECFRFVEPVVNRGIIFSFPAELSGTALGVFRVDRPWNYTYPLITNLTIKGYPATFNKQLGCGPGSAIRFSRPPVEPLVGHKREIVLSRKLHLVNLRSFEIGQLALTGPSLLPGNSGHLRQDREIQPFKPRTDVFGGYSEF
jgi:hypothetical protein